MAHARELADHMRAEDRAEVEAMGHTPHEAMERALQVSGRDCYAMLIDGKVAAVGGVATFNLLARAGSPWLLTTVLVEKHPKEFYRITRQAVSILRDQFDYLVNLVDTRHEKAMRWLRRLGFHVEPQPIKINSVMFVRITMGGAHV